MDALSEVLCAVRLVDGDPVELQAGDLILYPTRWRISLAAAQLRESNISIIRVATQVGYESESAFNRAFKREFGLPPAAWRKQAAR